MRWPGLVLNQGAPLTAALVPLRQRYKDSRGGKWEPCLLPRPPGARRGSASACVLSARQLSSPHSPSVLADHDWGRSEAMRITGSPYLSPITLQPLAK